MKIWRLSFYLMLGTTAYPQGWSSVTWDGGNITGNPGNCQSQPFPFQRSATYNWTLWCIDASGNFTSVRSTGTSIPPVTATGNGACPSGSLTACVDSSYTQVAPTFSPANPQLNSATQTWSMWLNVGNATLTGNPQLCGTPYNTVSPTSQTSNPSRCYCNPGDPSCKWTSPVVIDPTGEGFFMTDLANGVLFKKGPASASQQMAWTDPAHHTAFLVRPNPDGTVTSVSMNMFGNVSPQPQSAEPNGYAALAYWASQEGCGDLKKLDAQACPAVWNALRLWHDANQNGVADTGELLTMQDAGIYGISLNDHEDRYVDQYGNLFQFRAQVWSGNGDRRSYDVFLVIQ